MRLALLILILSLLLVACGGLPPFYATPTAEVPGATQPPIFATSTPVCSQADSHCNHLNEPINVGSDFAKVQPLTLPPGDTDIPLPSGEVIRHTVQYPPGYRWEFHLTAPINGRNVADWIPDIFYSRSAFRVNVTSMSGRFDLAMPVQALQAGMKYVVDWEYTPEVHLVDPGLSYEATHTSWIEQCAVLSDGGFLYTFPAQGLDNLRRAWSDRLTEHVTISFMAQRAMEVSIRCGLEFVWPSWEGAVYVEEFRLVPVNWRDEDIMRVLR